MDSRRTAESAGRPRIATAREQFPRVSNHSFNVKIVPLLQPDPERPGSTEDPTEPVPGAFQPRLDDPETGFATRRPWEEKRDSDRSPPVPIEALL